MESKQEKHGTALPTKYFGENFSASSRNARESAEKEAQLFPSIEKTELESLDAFEVGGEAGLYFGVPYEIGPIGKNLNTFA